MGLYLTETGKRLMAIVREANEKDVDELRDLFATVYGEDYPFPGFYDTHWLKKAIFSDNTVFLVAEVDGSIVATGSIMLDAGGQDDLIGELGRLVAVPSRKAAGAAKEVIAELLKQTSHRVQFSFGEVRTVHKGSQRLAEEFKWVPVGFEPLKYQFANRESVAIYANLQGFALELRRNNPRVIPEVSLLGQTVLRQMGMPVDIIVEDETDGYPTEQSFQVDRLQELGITPLLRIERGRVTNREIFGNFSLAHGFFAIANSNTHYLVARDGDAVLGAVGFLHDPIDSKVRIFELIEFDDAVKGFLLASVNKIAVEELDVAYQEVDVSAYSPKIQRTFERLGFVPVAYCPSMVFDNVERLDVIRMAKLNMIYDLGRMRLSQGTARIRQIVEQGLEDRLRGMEITESTRDVDIFKGLPDGDLQHLASIALIHKYPSETTLIRQGGRADMIYILAEGKAEARSDGRLFGVLGPGQIFGEMGLVEHTLRSADVVLTEDSKVIEIRIDRLERLMQAHPRLGFVVMNNLAKGLSEKLKTKNQACP